MKLWIGLILVLSITGCATAGTVQIMKKCHHIEDSETDYVCENP